MLRCRPSAFPLGLVHDQSRAVPREESRDRTTHTRSSSAPDRPSGPAPLFSLDLCIHPSACFKMKLKFKLLNPSYAIRIPRPRSLSYPLLPLAYPLFPSSLAISSTTKGQRYGLTINHRRTTCFPDSHSRGRNNRQVGPLRLLSCKESENNSSPRVTDKQRLVLGAFCFMITVSVSAIVIASHGY